MCMTPRLMYIYIYSIIYIFLINTCIQPNDVCCCSIADQERIAKPCSKEKSHEHGINHSTHPSFIETCKQLGNSTADFGKSVTIRPPTFVKSTTDFGKICHRLGKICHRLLGKSATDFLGNPSPILGKSVTDFGKISHRLW